MSLGLAFWWAIKKQFFNSCIFSDPVRQSNKATAKIEIRFSVAQNMQIYSSGKELHDVFSMKLSTSNTRLSRLSIDDISGINKARCKISHNKATQGNTYNTKWIILIIWALVEHSFFAFLAPICIHIALICNLNAILISDEKLVSCKFNLFHFVSRKVSYKLQHDGAQNLLEYWDALPTQPSTTSQTRQIIKRDFFISPFRFFISSTNVLSRGSASQNCSMDHVNGNLLERCRRNDNN